MASDSLDAVRDVINMSKTAFRPYDRYGKAIPGLSWLPLDFDEEKGSGLYLVRFPRRPLAAPRACLRRGLHRAGGAAHRQRRAGAEGG